MATSAGQESSAGTVPDTAAARTQLVHAIAGDLRRQRYHLVHLDPYPTQRIIDLRWAAQQAGRAVGWQVRAYTSAVGAYEVGRVSVIVAPVELPAHDRVFAMIQQLLAARGNLARIRRAS
jgi:hypothetical protein